MSAVPDAVPGRVLVRPVAALSVAVTILLGLCGLAELALGYTNAVMYSQLGQLLVDAEAVTDAELMSSAQRIAIAGYVSSGLTLVTAVVFLTWLWRARLNSEVIHDVRHRKARAWAVRGWLIPVVNLWIPKLIVDDIWRLSDARKPPHESGLEFTPHPGLVSAWWLFWLAYLLGGLLTLPLVAGDDEFLSLRRQVFYQLPVSAAGVIAAVLAVLVVLRITKMQVRSQAEG